jgi:glycosyltransferase involved in cell wall biosynthesis
MFLSSVAESPAEEDRPGGFKILFISAEPIRARQASDTHINEIVSGLRRAGHPVTICVTRATGEYSRTPFMRRIWGYLVFWFEALIQLRSSAVVYARAHPANFPVVFAARLFRIPVVHEVNGSYRDLSITHSWLKPIMGIIAAMQLFQYRKASALAAVTDQLAVWVRKEAPGVPVTVVANAANCKVFYQKRPKVRAVEGNYALFFGSLTRWHGIETMIAAAQHEAWPDRLALVIIGDGQLREIAQTASDRNPGIRLLPSVPQHLLVDYINAAAVGLVPINSIEGRGSLGLSPLKLYEMLACGLPSVVTDFPGQADLVRSLGAGIVVPPDDPASLARAVATLLANRLSSREMARIAAVIKAEHSWDSRAAEVEKLLFAAAGRKVS